MGEKDISRKALQEYNDVFADIINALLMNGEQIVRPEDLSDVNPRSNYNSRGKIREQERDIGKNWISGKCKIQIALLGMENQMEEEADMPIRVIGYDGASYRDQIKRKAKKRDERQRYPVVSIVLYFGYNHRWSKPKHLIDCFEVHDSIRKYVSDYHINVFDIAFLTDEEKSRFKSDFRFVVDYFTQLQRTGEYVPPSEKVVHVQEVLTLMAAITGDGRFEDAYVSNLVNRKENVGMDTLGLDSIECNELTSTMKGGEAICLTVDLLII